MGGFKVIEGDLFDHINNFEFDVVAHGVNCFCTMGAGIAILFKKHFKADTFKMEALPLKGDFNKLGQIDYEVLHYSTWDNEFQKYPDDGDEIKHSMYAVNAYTQYDYGFRNGIPLDYEALILCMRKINHQFKGKRIGLPLIGGGLAGGNLNKIIEIMTNELIDCDVTLVLFPENKK